MKLVIYNTIPSKSNGIFPHFIAHHHAGKSISDKIDKLTTLAELNNDSRRSICGELVGDWYREHADE